MSSCRGRLLLLSSSSLLLLSAMLGLAPAQTQPAPESPAPAAPAAPAPTDTPSQPAEQPAPEAAPPQGVTPIPPITVSPSPTASPPRRPTVPAAQPAATTTPTAAPPQRTAVPSTPAPNLTSPTQTFNQQRDNIFAPLGTAPTTLSREAIEALPQGTNTPFDKVLLQLPGVTQDTAAAGSLHVRNEHANVSYRINGILLPDGLSGLGQFLDTSFIGSLTLITGALPAQYGLRTAGIVDIKTAYLQQQRPDRRLRGQPRNHQLQHPIRRQVRQHGIFLYRTRPAEHSRHREYDAAYQCDL